MQNSIGRCPSACLQEIILPDGEKNLIINLKNIGIMESFSSQDNREN